ncbi:hypothetical protein Tco_1500969 [Tanacetum coccineum]
MIGFYLYYPPENKTFVARYVKFNKGGLIISQEASGSTVEDENVIPHNVETPVYRSTRIPLAHERYGFYVDAKEHELGDHGEPVNYKAALSDPESDKWLEL